MIAIKRKLKMKKLIMSVLLVTFVLAARALLVVVFSGWGQLTVDSPNIFIARCTQTPLSAETNLQIQNELVVHSDIKIVSILKGVTNGIPSENLKLGPTFLSSEYWPRQGEYYLIFSHYRDGSHQAIEKYRIIPLGMRFPAETIAGKTLDEQLQILFKWRLFYLNQQMQTEQEEKRRLEEGIKKQ